MFLQSKNIWKDTADNRLTVDELKTNVIYWWIILR